MIRIFLDRLDKAIPEPHPYRLNHHRGSSYAVTGKVKARDCACLHDAYQEMQSDFGGRRTYLKQTSALPDVRTKRYGSAERWAGWVAVGSRRNSRPALKYLS